MRMILRILLVVAATSVCVATIHAQNAQIPSNLKDSKAVVDLKQFKPVQGAEVAQLERLSCTLAVNYSVTNNAMGAVTATTSPVKNVVQCAVSTEANSAFTYFARTALEIPLASWF